MKLKSICLNLLVAAGLGLPLLSAALENLPAETGKNVTAIRDTDLRADKLSSAPVLQKVPAGAALRLVSMEGGWALVETQLPQDKGGVTAAGWVRASAVSLQVGGSAASSMANGREASGNAALTLGTRSLPQRANRHALIIGIGRYADPTTPQLPGVRIDRQSATQMALAMQVPAGNISYLQDDQATGDGIRQALKDLTAKVQDGDRVFIHYSGHGTRYNDPAAGGCVEALLPFDGSQNGTITNREMADMLKPITNKTDKLFVMYDACHAGGVVQASASVRTRGFSNRNDEGTLRPKFSNITEECGRPVNVKTRNLTVSAAATGVLPQDIIHVSASRNDEISFDDEQKGGLATQFMRDCMLRDAKDLDNSGAVSVDEIRQCAQEKINTRMVNDANYKPHHLVLNGNAGFVPAWFSQASTNPAIAAVPLTGAQALRQMFDQRDAKRSVELTMAKDKFKIDQDDLDFSVKSERAGYVYVALAGSDNKSVYLLFPNALDKSNRIEAGQKLQLPRPSWRIAPTGPAGLDSLLVLVTDSPRAIASLGFSTSSPFAMTLNDAQGRAKLGALMTTSEMADDQTCAAENATQRNSLCSDAYAAAIATLEEIK